MACSASLMSGVVKVLCWSALWASTIEPKAHLFLKHGEEEPQDRDAKDHEDVDGNQKFNVYLDLGRFNSVSMASIGEPVTHSCSLECPRCFQVRKYNANQDVSTPH